MTSLPEFAVRNRTIVITVVTLLVIWGAVSFQTMPRREDPEFTLMTCVVTTEWDGVPAERVEELITDPLEEILDGIEEVEHVRSTSITGLSTIYLDLFDSVDPRDVDQVWDKVRARVRNVSMPQDEISPVVEDDFGDTSVIVFAVYQKPMPGQEAIDPAVQYSDRELDVFSDRVRDALRLIPGVAKAQRYGVREEAIYVETDAGTWAQQLLTSSELGRLIESRNIVESGGLLDTGDGRVFITPGGELDGVEEINSIVGSVAGVENQRNHVYLRDLGLTVRRGYRDPPALLCRYGDPDTSQPAVMVALTMKSGANIMKICEAARDRVARLQHVDKQLPPDLGVVPVSDQSESVDARIGEVILNVVQAIVIVVVVVYLVVGFRTAAVMAANIPVVMLASVGIITWFDVQLEQMSLASMIIALGLLVDNAVQVCDQARTNQIAGMNAEDAAVNGAKVLSVPMLNGTLTTIAAFVPMAIMFEGGTREFIYSLPVTLSVMLGVSWLLAMTFCVILAAAFIRPPQTSKGPVTPVMKLWQAVTRRLRRSTKTVAADQVPIRRIDRIYHAFARLAVRYKFVTVVVAFGLLVLAFQLPVSSEFFPQAERDQFVVGVWLPENVSLQQTNQAALRVEQIIRRLSSVHANADATGERLRAMRTIVGGGGSRWYLSWNPEPRKPNYAEILVRTTDGKFTHDYAEQVRRVALEGDESLNIRPLAGVRVVPVELMLGPPADPVTLRVSGEGFADPARLRKVAAAVKGFVRDQTGTWNVHDSWGIDGYQLRVNVDEDRANLAGVTNVQIANTLSAYYSGHRLTTFREGDHTVPVYFRLAPEGRTSTSVTKTAFIEGEAGRVPLRSIAKVDLGWSPAVVERRDLNRTIEVRARVEPGVSGNDIVANVMASEEMRQLKAALPTGFEIEVGGALEESQEAGKKMLLSFAVSFVSVLLLLVIQFNSIFKSLIIITTLPLALIGALFGLWVTNQPLGFMPQLGILALFGIVVNTAIIFIEFADILIRRESNRDGAEGSISGLTRDQFRECLVAAGQQRLVPIFLTTATTVGGLFSLAVAGGPLWTGMAWLMVFGLLVATLLTLLVVPALYAIVVETFHIAPVPRPVRNDARSATS